MSNEVASNARVTDEGLKPCPFCGGEASAAGTVRYSDGCVERGEVSQNEFYYCNCIVCGASNMGLIGHLSRDDAVAAWNRRLAPQASPAPDELEVVAWLVDCFVEPVVEFRNPGDFAIPLVRLTDATRLLEQERAEKARLAEECQQSMGTIARERRRAEAAEARNAELVKAMEDARQVLAKLLSAGHNSPPATPEEIDAAFWSVDATLGGQSNG